MSSPDAGPRRRAVVLALAAGAAAALAGCQVRPLYAEWSADGAADTGADARLRRVAVEVQKDRVGQELMNQLIFALRGGSDLVDPAYTVRLIVRTRKSEVAIQEREEVPTANMITVTTTYTLSENVSGRVITSDTIYTTASYEFSSQRYANLRAERDAENRAVRTAANDIRTRLAIALSAEGG
jgi:LPS-assembly lipoprotein